MTRQEGLGCSKMAVRVAILTVVIQVLVPVYRHVDQKIDGRWREYPPFSFLPHPHIDMYKSGIELIEQEGYHVESHWVTTDDGYINGVFRVTKEPPKEGQSRPAVVFIHGLIDSSDSFVVNKKKSQPFILADEGYDVWLANTRGNRYSRNHTILDSTTDSKYWDGAYDYEIARHDVPAFIEYAKNKSGVQSVSLVGHS